MTEGRCRSPSSFDRLRMRAGEGDEGLEDGWSLGGRWALDGGETFEGRDEGVGQTIRALVRRGRREWAMNRTGLPEREEISGDALCDLTGSTGVSLNPHPELVEGRGFMH